MKKLISFVAAAMLCGLVSAQKVSVTLNDGKVIDGTLSSSLADGATKVYVKNEADGQKTEYTTADVKTLTLTSDKGETATYIPMTAQRGLPSVWNKNPKPYKEPVFMQPIYSGKNVSAYAMPISGVSNGRNATGTYTQTTYTLHQFYFKVNSEDIAKGYWMSGSIGAKAMMKLVFKPYPQMKEVIKNMDFDEFYKDPALIIRKFDETF